MRRELARFDRHPLVAFARRHPSRAGVTQLVAAALIKMRERDRHGAVRNFIDQQVNENRSRPARPVRARVIHDLQIIGEIEGKPVVGAAQFRSNYFCAGEMIVEQVASGDDPAFDRRNEQGPIEVRAYNSE